MHEATQRIKEHFQSVAHMCACVCVYREENGEEKQVWDFIRACSKVEVMVLY